MSDKQGDSESAVQEGLAGRSLYSVESEPSTVDGVAEAWEREQLRLKAEIVERDDVSFDPKTFEGLKYIGGVDISFVCIFRFVSCCYTRLVFYLLMASILPKMREC
jgi:hypothetical protein